MCSHKMENYQGDLADIVRASGGSVTGSYTATTAATITSSVDPSAAVPGWQFPANPINFSSNIEEGSDDFGHPFSRIKDPFFSETGSGFFTNSMDVIKTGAQDNIPGSSQVFSGGNKPFLDDGTKKPSMFSRMLQISPNTKLPIVAPCDSPVGLMKGGPMLVPNDRMISPNSSKGCLVENMQISSPRNTGIKRRKSQAKKVVCIPAPAPANTRSSGEIVPSDLWAWRKYGQKPIKGSPYPRGYYRCSSSKGCSARKQVERSRTDPNMLVITYTSEHNHPWPTQRNALAGSTRSQPSKNSSTSTSNQASKNNTPNPQPQKSTNQEEKKQKESNAENVQECPVPVVKEEKDQDFGQNELEMENLEFNEGFPQSYRPTLGDQSRDFFADLAEIEAHPLDLLFTQGFSGDEDRDNKALDPFSFYDWPASNDNSNNNSTPSYGEAKRESSKNQAP